MSGVCSLEGCRCRCVGQPPDGLPEDLKQSFLHHVKEAGIRLDLCQFHHDKHHPWAVEARLRQELGFVKRALTRAEQASAALLTSAGTLKGKIRLRVGSGDVLQTAERVLEEANIVRGRIAATQELAS